MVRKTADVLPDLYEADETAWLDTMAALIEQGRLKELDYASLAGYLADMAKRDRREVESRLTLLMTHLLKWQFQPRKRTGSWRSTIRAQSQELRRDLAGGVLRNHAETMLPELYVDAVERASDETGLPKKRFPGECPYSLDQLLAAAALEE